MKKIMKNLKKIPTLLMLVLSVVMTVPANVFAIEATTPGTATVTIKGIDEKYNDVTVNAYRIIDTNINNGQPKTPVYTWRDTVVEWIKEKHPEFIDEANSIKTTDGEGNEVITNYAVAAKFTPCENENESSETRTCLNKNDAIKFYDELANAIRNQNAKINGGSKLEADKTANKDNENENGDIELAGLTMGNYLILIEGGMNVYRPSAINIVPEYNKTSKAWEVKDATIEVKSSTPSIDKTVEGADPEKAKVGDTVTYTIKVQIPEYPENAIAKQIEISDTLDKGLTLDTTSIVVKANTTDNFAQADTLTKGTNYTLPDPSKVDGKDTFKVTITNTQYDTLKNANNVPYRYVYVTYKATINSNAIVSTCEEVENEDGTTSTVCTGNKNNAQLRYNNNPYDSNSWEEDKKDTETVYTYGIKLDKIDEEEEYVKDENGEYILDEDGNKVTRKVYLPGAKFTIADANGNIIDFVADPDHAGVYHKAVTAAEATANPDLTADTNIVEGGILEVSSDGHLEVTGLAAGTYKVTEVEAPKGYIKLQNPITITIKDTNKNGLVEDENGNDLDSGYVFEEVPNSDDMHVLPVTGGIGTILFSVIGILFMGLGAFLIKNILKKEDVQ